MDMLLIPGSKLLSKSIPYNPLYLTYGIIGSSVAGIATIGALGGAKMYDYLRSETAPNVELVDNHILNEKVKEVVSKDNEQKKIEEEVKVIIQEANEGKSNPSNVLKKIESLNQSRHYQDMSILLLVFSFIIVYIKVYQE